MKKYVKFLTIIVIMFTMMIGINVNAEEYTLNNLKENQEFMCGDSISIYTPPDMILSDEDTIYNKYGNFEILYGRSFTFIFLDSSTISVVANGCNALNCGSISIPCSYDGKDIYWKITKVDYDFTLEGFEIQFSAIEKDTEEIAADEEKEDIKTEETIVNPETAGTIGIVTLLAIISLVLVINRRKANNN